MTAYPHAFRDGRWLPKDQAAVPLGSLALRYGLSAFEGIRLYAQADGREPRPFLLEAHLERLERTLRLLRFPDPGVGRLDGIVEELSDRNGITEDAYVRVAVTPANPGQIGDGVEPVLTVTATPMSRKRWLARGEAMRLQVSGWERAGPAVFPPAAKNISAYAGSRLALLDALDLGFDSCVLRNRQGRLCEAPTANLFLVRGGVLRTPPLTEDVLPGITRAWVLSAARALGIPAEETPLAVREAYDADEAFLCGTGLEFGPVRSFDGHDLRDWRQALVTWRLIRHYFATVRGGTVSGDPLPWRGVLVPEGDAR